MKFVRRSALLVTTVVIALIATGANAQNSRSMGAEKARVVAHWTADRRAAAKPRDLVIDERGLGYMRLQDGSLQPYGHQLSAQSSGSRGQAPAAKPGDGSGDSSGPTISSFNPALGDTIGASHTFSADVSDDSGVRSVTFVLIYPDGTTTQSFSAEDGGNGTWSNTLQGFTDGDWSWRVEARDATKGRGNVTVSANTSFTVSTGGGGGGGGGTGDTVIDSQWSDGGDIQGTVGRIFFEMPGNARRKGPWSGYVCSGTVVTDNITGKSVILTAAHCVYDDANGAFARNALFIPDQASGGSSTDRNCDNDPIGCWVASYGVVDANWTQQVFPANIEWDSAYYVVEDSGAHSGSYASSDALDSAVTTLTIDWSAPQVNQSDATDFTHGIGYSYSHDPQLRYCAEDMTTEGDVNWWLPSCELSGGSSGGPWVQPMSGGTGPIISVNSWGYTTSAGMAGPKLSNPSHRCVFDAANDANNAVPSGTADGDAGVIASCP